MDVLHPGFAVYYLLGGKQCSLLAAPLIRHRIRNSPERAAAFFPAIRAGRHPVNPVLPAFDNLRVSQRWESFQPKARRFRLAMPELPRLDDLVGLAPHPGHDANRVLYRNIRDRRACQRHEKANG